MDETSRLRKKILTFVKGTRDGWLLYTTASRFCCLITFGDLGRNIYILFCLQKWNIFDITVHIELFRKRRGKMYATIWNTEFIFPKIREIEFRYLYDYDFSFFLFLKLYNFLISLWHEYSNIFSPSP